MLHAVLLDLGLLLKSKLSALPIPCFLTCSLVENLPTIKPTKVVLQPPT